MWGSKGIMPLAEVGRQSLPIQKGLLQQAKEVLACWSNKCKQSGMDYFKTNLP